MNLLNKKTAVLVAIILAGVLHGNINKAKATTLGFADVVLDFHDSGAGPIAGPYGIIGNDFIIPVTLDVVLGDDEGKLDALSLPTGSFVTVGFTDETVIDGEGDDIFILEEGSALDRADIFVSADGIDFTFIGQSDGGQLNSFDLATIGFTDPVIAVKILGLDLNGGSPGFDLVNVQVLPGSIGGAPIGGGGSGGGTEVPEPGTMLLFGSGLLGGYLRKKRAN